MDKERAFLREQMLYCAYKSNCFHDLKREAVLCGKVVDVRLGIGDYVLVEFPISDVTDDKLLHDLLDRLQELYAEKFNYYRHRIMEWDSEYVKSRDGTQT